MNVFPAIDLKNGQCVRLTQGDFSTATIYEADPLLQAEKFLSAGASWLHMVDLDGAKAGQMQQFEIIAKMAKNVPIQIQVGGGIRDADTIRKLLDIGIKRVVIGSLAVKNPSLIRRWLKDFGSDAIVVAFDIRLDADNSPEILTHGWQQGSRLSLWDILQDYTGSGLKTILCTDVSRDGMLEGSNHALYSAIQKLWPDVDILASGGVDGLQDVLELEKLGLAGVITGKAIYEGRLDLSDAIRKLSHAG